jgi:hypothetical protein
MLIYKQLKSKPLIEFLRVWMLCLAAALLKQVMRQKKNVGGCDP